MADININTRKFAVRIGIREAVQTVTDTALNKPFFHGVQCRSRMGLDPLQQTTRPRRPVGYHRLFIMHPSGEIYRYRGVLNAFDLSGLQRLKQT